MTLRAKRHPRNVLVLVGAVSVLTFACNGTIMDGPGGSGPGTGGPGTGGPGTGGPGSPGGPGEPNKNPNLPQPPGAQACDSKAFTPARVWRLSDEQFVAAVKDLLPGRRASRPSSRPAGRPSSSSTSPSCSRSARPPPATSAPPPTRSPPRRSRPWTRCWPARPGRRRRPVPTRFIDGLRLARVPPSAGPGARSDGLKAVYDAGVGVNQAEGIRMAITAVLQSGSFLYRTELGKGNTVAAGQTVELTHPRAGLVAVVPVAELDPRPRAAGGRGRRHPGQGRRVQGPGRAVAEVCPGCRTT